MDRPRPDADEEELMARVRERAPAPVRGLEDCASEEIPARLGVNRRDATLRTRSGIPLDGPDLSVRRPP